jgi:hypothetical protein
VWRGGWTRREEKSNNSEEQSGGIEISVCSACH